MLKLPISVMENVLEILDNLPATTEINTLTLARITLLFIIIVSLLLVLIFITKLINLLTQRLFPEAVSLVYQKTIAPFQD